MTPSAGPPITRRAALRRLAAIGVGAAVVPTLWLDGCAGQEPIPIAYGREECAWCRMTVSDARYGAMQLNAQGKRRVFDSVECLAHATLALEVSARASASRRSWVTDSPAPGTLVPASVATYLRSEAPGSPMGKGIRAFASVADAERERRLNGGTTMSWDQMLTLVGSDRASRG